MLSLLFEGLLFGNKNSFFFLFFHFFFHLAVGTQVRKNFVIIFIMRYQLQSKSGEHGQILNAVWLQQTPK